MKAADGASRLTGEKGGGALTDTGEAACPSLCVDGHKADSLHQASRFSTELSCRGGHGTAGADHAALWSRVWLM